MPRRPVASALSIGLLLTSAVLVPRLHAMFIARDSENVPIDRVIENLEHRVAENPADVKTRVNLARVHAMAWATKGAETRVFKSGLGGPPGDPDFGNLPGFQGVQVRQTLDPEAQRVAAEHLHRAIEQYRAALEVEPANEVALLGQAWCSDQAGDKAQAIAGYRKVLELVWPRESSGHLPVTNFGIVPTTTEVAGYLIPLLDPEKDASEVATIRAHVSQVNSVLRPVTPIVVPLRDDLRVSDLIDVRARVAFDADGSGLQRPWTWITPDAGWLVFDKHGTGQIRSALQWFGRVTFWLFWDDGYDALRALDDNDDGVLRGRELDGIAIWRDRNGDGVTEPGEVKPLTAWGIVSVSCLHIVADDDPTIAAWSPVGVTFADGKTRPTYDVLLFPR